MIRKLELAVVLAQSEQRRLNPPPVPAKPALRAPKKAPLNSDQLNPPCVGAPIIEAGIALGSDVFYVYSEKVGRWQRSAAKWLEEARGHRQKVTV